MLTTLSREAAAYGVRLTPVQMRQFETYLALLTDWSKRVNLVGNVEAEVVQRRHFLESAALVALLHQEGLTLRDRSLIDVGSGSGIPGIPLKIIEPSLQLTLVEAKQRKSEFLLAVLPEIGLSDVTVITRRAEEAGHDPRHREQYDFAVAKALAPLRTLAELTLPLVRMGGLVLAPKGKGAENEVKEARTALETLKGTVRSIEPLPLSSPPQTVIIIDKELPTPQRFPRRPGIPAKRPL